MHDCRQTQAQLNDLAFNELAPAARERVLAEVADCAACQTEYLALATLLRACAQVELAAEPPADYWPGYHARLAARVHALEDEPRAAHVAPAAVHTGARHAGIFAALRRTLTTTLHVPVPVACAVALALVGLSMLALRTAPGGQLPAAPQAAQSPAPVRVIEVPVVQEKIVTRTVYVARRERVRARGAAQTLQTDGAQLARRGKDAAAEPAAQSALAGFQPAGEVKLRVIKGSFTHER